MLSGLLNAIETWGYQYEMAEERLTDENYDEYNMEFFKEELVIFDQMSKDVTKKKKEHFRPQGTHTLPKC